MVSITPKCVAVAALLLACAWPAHAQIYSWRDARGALVLSDKPPAGYPPSRNTAKADGAFRAARPARRQFPDRYEDLIAKHANTYAVSRELVRAVVQVESGFDPYARSPKGAMGLMQLMPGTAIEMGVTNPFDPDQNIRGGVAYLRQLLNRYAGNVSMALAAYNAGPAVVDRHGAGVPYAETRNYVSRLTGGAEPMSGRPSQSAAGNRPSAAQSPAPDKGRATTAVAARPVYKTVEIIDGRPVARYTDTRPSSGPYELVSRR
ncbi:MAG: lytic transglycosylase domain-containing protein [Bacteroidales bacterium]